MNTPALSRISSLALAVCAFTACSANSGDPGGTANGTGGVMWGSSGSTGAGGLTVGGGGQSSGGDLGFPVGGNSGNGSGGSGGEECPAVSQKAEQISGGKADIIWAIDSSGSMATELAAVQDNMNRFSQIIIDTKIDVHVIAVAVAQQDLFGFITPGLCIVPPLGSGSCINGADSRPPIYTHIPQVVDSHDALGQLMRTYPQWQSAIRPDSTKTFVVVTDDEANDSPTVAEFRAFFDNAFTGSKWRFSGIYCRGSSANCENPGNMYDELLNASGGVWADLGNTNPDWNAVFKQLSDAVVADAKPVDCEWKIPPAPTGLVFDKKKVNVDFTPTSGIKESFLKVLDQQACPASGDGWFYDNENTPTAVRVCAQTCTKIQADQGAKIDVVFGCDTKNRPIM